MTDADLIDRRHAQLAVFREAEKEYEATTGERIAHWQRRLLARYTRNLALAGNELTAGLFDLTVAARSVADDNYAWDVWEAAGRYPPQRTAADVLTVRISGEEMWRDTRRIRLRRRLPSTKRRLRPFGLKPRKKEKFPGEWASQLNGTGICSYPPEDLVIEDYGRFLKKKGKSILSEERVRVEPFTTSILDGIDMRETIRKWYEGRIYVRQFQKIQGEVGSVVVIFDEDRDNRYPYTDHLAGREPERIGHGVLLHLPVRQPGGAGHRPRRIRRLPDEPAAAPHVRRLAGCGLRIRRIEIRAAAAGGARLFDPPLRGLRGGPARRARSSRPSPRGSGRTIIYIPIGQLSPVSLKKIRVVHVLDGYDKREIAKDYLW